MKNGKKIVPAFVLVFCCVFSLNLFAEVMTIGSALNKSGKQRMLTQNILKNYLALGLEVDAMRTRKELDRSVALFEEQIQQLSDYAPDDAVKASLSKVEDLWFEYRSLAITTYSETNAVKMLDKNNAILRACHQVVLDLESYAGRQSAKMVNTSGRQRMLSQRIAAYYLAHALGFRDKETVDAFETALLEYGLGLNALIAFPDNTMEIKQALKKVDAQWKFSNIGFDQIENGNYVPHVIKVTTNGMLKKMDAITSLYEDLDRSMERSALAASYE